MALALSVQLARGEFTLEASCEIPTVGVTALFGRSGSGKTTLLRCIAGLERIGGARVRFDEQIWQDDRQFVPTHRRAVGFAFQEAALFAHIDVRANLEYGWRRVPPTQRRVQFDEAVELLGLEALLSHRTPQLSGGERQRVAIARALLSSPQLLLLDEPLSHLDDTSKAEILPHLTRLRASLSIPLIYVSHALGEVMRLADHLLLLEGGRISAAGPLQQLLTRADLPFGQLEHAGSVIEGMIDEHDSRFHLSFVRTAAGRLAISLKPLAIGQRVRVRIDARDVSIALRPPELSSISNILPATILELRTDRDPAQALVVLDVGGERLLARITQRSVAQLALASGTPVYAQIKSAALAEH